MAKKKKPPYAKGRGRCIFCGGGGVRGNPMSDEHLWPIWMHPHLPRIPNAKNWTAAISETFDSTETLRKKPRMGHVFTKKLKLVCKKCNETWMGEIEEDAKPILLPVIQGKRFLLDHDNRIKLATWLILKFLVADNDKDTSPISSKDILTAFFERREFPERIKIWIAHHNEFQWSAGCWNRGLTISFEPKPPRSGLRKNVQTVALGVGHLFSLSCLSLTERINLEINNPFTAQLWPSDFSVIEWPPPLIPPGGTGAIANVLDRLEANPNVKWGKPDNS